MKTILTLVVIFFSSSTFALSSYYNEQDRQELDHGNLSNQSLLSYVGRVSSRNFRPLGYKKSMKKILFGRISLEVDERGEFIEDVYCEYTLRDGQGTRIGRDIIPRNEVLNVEHTWPQSLGAKREPARGDMHHLFPTDSRANSTRGNHPFAEVNGKDARDNCELSQVGNAIDPQTGKTTNIHAFEPPIKHRGNVARAMFYVAAKYSYRISAIEEAYLRKWNREDPVDASEIKRNDMIEQAQGNRNPFIDYPELATRISDF